MRIPLRHLPSDLQPNIWHSLISYNPAGFAVSTDSTLSQRDKARIRHMLEVIYEHIKTPKIKLILLGDSTMPYQCDVIYDRKHPVFAFKRAIDSLPLEHLVKMADEFDVFLKYVKDNSKILLGGDVAKSVYFIASLHEQAPYLALFLLRVLYEQGFTIDAKNDYRLTGLELAIRNKNKRACRFLLLEGASRQGLSTEASKKLATIDSFDDQEDPAQYKRRRINTSCGMEYLKPNF